jgi:hypothetical protein
LLEQKPGVPSNLGTIVGGAPGVMWGSQCKGLDATGAATPVAKAKLQELLIGEGYVRRTRHQGHAAAQGRGLPF